MIYSPRYAIQQGWITGVPEHCVQPNAIDITLDTLYEVEGEEGPCFCMVEDSTTGQNVFKRMYKQTLVLTRSEYTLRSTSDSTDICNFTGWFLESNSVYDGMSNMYVALPEGVVARLIVRSSLARNGIRMNSGLYDQGFQGNVGFVLHPRFNAHLSQGVRVGQIIFEKADSAGELYAGGYNTSNGQHWTQKDGN